MDSGTHGLWGGEAMQPSQGKEPDIVYGGAHFIVMKRFAFYKPSGRRKAVLCHTKLQISYSFTFSQCAERLGKTRLFPKRWKSVSHRFIVETGFNITCLG